MSKNNFSKEELGIFLKQALERKDTDKVYELYKAGANLEGLTIIGISNIDGAWSGNVAKSVVAFMKQNSGFYYLHVNEINHVQDDKFIKNFSGLINPGAEDSFPKDRAFQLSDLDKAKMLHNEHLYQAIINQSNKFHIPYLGICSGSQHLVLNNEGFIKKEPGYLGGNHRANFLYGTIPYFMMLEKKEQEKALSECVFPEVSFPIYTAHNYAAQKDNLGGVKLAAVSEEGVVQSHSKGTTQIGVQFHPENYYAEFTPETKINRQKQFLDNFFGLCVRHNEILDFARKNGLSEQSLYDRMNMYDVAILSRLQECANKGVSPIPLTNNYFDDYEVCLNPNFLAKESYNEIIAGKINSHLNKIDFSDPQMKYYALQAIEDSQTLQQFLQLDQQPQSVQDLFLKLEEALHSSDKEPSLIAQEFSNLFKAPGELRKYALIRAIKANHIELAAEIVANDFLY